MMPHHSHKPKVNSPKITVYVETRRSRLEQFGESLKFTAEIITSVTVLVTAASTIAFAFDGVFFPKSANPLYGEVCADVSRWLEADADSGRPEGYEAADRAFWANHPELPYGYDIQPHETEYAKEWDGYVDSVKACRKELGKE